MYGSCNRFYTSREYFARKEMNPANSSRCCICSCVYWNSRKEKNFFNLPKFGGGYRGESQILPLRSSWTHLSRNLQGEPVTSHSTYCYHNNRRACLQAWYPVAFSWQHLFVNVPNCVKIARNTMVFLSYLISLLFSWKPSRRVLPQGT